MLARGPALAVVLLVCVGGVGCVEAPPIRFDIDSATIEVSSSEPRDLAFIEIAGNITYFPEEENGPTAIVGVGDAFVHAGNFPKLDLDFELGFDREFDSPRERHRVTVLNHATPNSALTDLCVISVPVELTIVIELWTTDGSLSSFSLTHALIGCPSPAPEGDDPMNMGSR